MSEPVRYGAEVRLRAPRVESRSGGGWITVWPNGDTSEWAMSAEAVRITRDATYRRLQELEAVLAVIRDAPVVLAGEHQPGPDDDGVRYCEVCDYCWPCPAVEPAVLCQYRRPDSDYRR